LSVSQACPLNPLPEMSNGADNSFAPVQRWNHFSDCFTAAIRCVVDFARSIPGFHLLSHEDQVTLLKAGTFEVMLVHLACLFDAKSNTMLFTSGKIFQRTALSVRDANVNSP
jgi:nuclear receptor subfamily 1 group D member 3